MRALKYFFMIRFFRRKKQTVPLIFTSFQKMGARINKQQRKWADYLNGKVKGAAHGSKMFWLIVFCFLFGGSSIFLMVSSVGESARQLLIDRISVPSFMMQDKDPSDFIPLPILSKNEYENILAFEKYMDSLKNTPAAKLKYDSICIIRPGLMDTLLLIKELFLQQSKTR